MPAKHFVFVDRDGLSIREPAIKAMPLWLIRDGIHFERTGHAVRFMSDDVQDTAVVYVERPAELYYQEADRIRSVIDMNRQRLREMEGKE